MTETGRHRQYYPLFVSLEGRVCLVVGGGAVGERKVRGLLSCGAGATLWLVAEKLTPWLQAQCDEGTVLLVGKRYTTAYLEGTDLVFAATNDFTLNRKIAADAESRRLWCNMATEPEGGSFIVPSVLQRGRLTIAVSTGGASPALAAGIRRKLEQDFGTEWTILLNFMTLLRTRIQERGLESAQNQELYRKIAQLPLPEWVRKGEEIRIIEAIADSCYPWFSPTELTQIWNEAWKHSSL